jgi:hypothetical protein
MDDSVRQYRKELNEIEIDKENMFLQIDKKDKEIELCKQKIIKLKVIEKEKNSAVESISAKDEELEKLRQKFISLQEYVKSIKIELKEKVEIIERNNQELEKAELKAAKDIRTR